MASTKTGKRQPPKPQAPQKRRTNSLLGERRFQLLAAVAIVVVGVIVAFASRGDHKTINGQAVSGLPDTPDYHSLLVSPSNARTVLLGTHDGLFRSRDGGGHWARYALAGSDAMNLTRPVAGGVTWIAGHDVFARSSDGGTSWQALNPSGLPSLDLHGFAVDPKHPATLYAAVAGAGLFRSTNAGASFVQVSAEVGGAVMALAVTDGGAILAGDMQRGLLKSADGGRSWRPILNAQLAGLAISPANPKLILATGPGILRSTDGGKSWRRVRRVDADAGPVAFAPSNANVSYVVGFDRRLYRSSDGELGFGGR